MTPQQFKRIRKALGMTQVELGAALDIHHRTVRKYESGELDITVMLDLAMAFLKISHAAKNETIGM